MKPKKTTSAPPPGVRRPVNYADDFAKEVRTNIIMEEPLVMEAQSITGIKTKTGVVHHALRELVRRQKMKEVLGMRGKVDFWDGYEADHVNP
jgi:Arc/MetJ family transcription regulator